MTKYSYRPCKPNEIKPLDMIEALAENHNAETYEAWSWDSDHEEGSTIDMQLLWFQNRAMICISGSGGGNSIWTDATDIADAIERFLEINGKKISE